MRIMTLQTPARIYTVTETETPYGGRTFQFTAAGTVWGDFRPDAPMVETAEGDVCIVQDADFIVRSAQGLARGGRLNLKGFDWRIISVDEQSDRSVRLRIARGAA